MIEELILKAQIRETFGKKLRPLRKKGFVPAILYGHKIKNVPLLIQHRDFHQILKKAGFSTLVDLVIGDEKPVKILISDVQYDPISSDFIHADLHQIKMTEKIRTEIPIRLEGDSKAVIGLEGNLIQNKGALEIECLPADLIPEIIASIEPLKTFDDKILVSDLQVPENITVLNNPEDLVAQVTPPRSEEELEELEEKVEENVEEVEAIEEKPVEGEEAAEGEVPATETTPAIAPENKEEKK
jgi:large subunit ribosomal protein L25